MQISNLKNFLEEVGFGSHSPEDYQPKDIKLRDGRNAILWVNRNNGHGILDKNYWEDNTEFYKEQYRQEFSANLNTHATAEEQLEVYTDLNKKQFEQFSNLISENTKYLEVGCSHGGILKHVAKQNLKICHAVEPSQNDIQFLKSKFDNVIFHNSLFEHADLDSNTYNLIASFEVLEHVESPKGFIEKAKSLLEPGGVLHLEVPNHHDAMLVNYDIPYYRDFYYHKAHIHYFTPKSLSELCAQCGFGGKVSSFQMYPMLNQIQWILNNKPQSSAKLALNERLPYISENQKNNQITNFFDDMSKSYNKLVEELLIGDCLIYQGVATK